MASRAAFEAVRVKRVSPFTASARPPSGGRRQHLAPQAPPRPSLIVRSAVKGLAAAARHQPQLARAVAERAAQAESRSLSCSPP